MCTKLKSDRIGNLLLHDLKVKCSHMIELFLGILHKLKSGDTTELFIVRIRPNLASVCSETAFHQPSFHEFCQIVTGKFDCKIILKVLPVK
jgi:hypothetical protein